MCTALLYTRLYATKATHQKKLHLLVVLLAIVVLTIATYVHLGGLAEAVWERLSRGDNGRIYEEYLPALARWHGGDMTTWIWGILPGDNFLTHGGQQRTYLHNVVLYFLVFHGLTGLLILGILYMFVLKTLHTCASRGPVAHQAVAISILSLLIAITVHALFFSVHKSLGYNAMLAAIIGISVNIACKTSPNNAHHENQSHRLSEIH